MSFSTNKIDWTQWEAFNQNKSFKLPPNDGKKIIYFRVTDFVGNVANPVSTTITLNRSNEMDIINGSTDGNKTNNNKQDDGKTDDEKSLKANKVSFGFEMWVMLFVIIIILLIIFALIIKHNKHSKQKLTTSEGVPIKPSTTQIYALAQPQASETTIPTVIQPQDKPSISTPQQVQAPKTQQISLPDKPTQLLLTQAPTQVEFIPEKQQIKNVMELTKREQLEMLDDQLLLGEISEATYIKLKNELDQELSAPKLPANEDAQIQIQPQVQPQTEIAKESEIT